MVSIDTNYPSEKSGNSGLFSGCRAFPMPAERGFMPDLAAMLVRSSIKTLPSRDCSCAGCHRTPLAGEQLHELDGGRMLCDLCFADLPEEQRLAVRTERVRASERRLAVVRRAA
jgi:hypothetical protein